jgi:hypothetical protein
MLWIALAAAAAQLSAPVPVNPEKWFTNEDVLVYVLEKDSGLWEVGIRLTISLDGTVQSCKVETPSNVPALDVLTCGIASHRARFHPARSSDGSASFGVYRDSVEWSVGDATSLAPFASNPDVDTFVQSLPSRIKSPNLVRVMFVVDEAENKSSCVAEPGPSLEKINNDPVLVPIACEQVMSMYRATPAKDASGRAVPSV